MRLPRLWHNRDFRYFWAAAVVSTYGSLVRATALMFTAIFLLDPSPAEMGLLRIAELLPALLIGLIAGVWVDRVRRRPVMIATDLLRALVLLSVPLAAALGWLGFGQLFVVAALVSVFGVLFDVAYQTYLPTLVKSDELIEANSSLSAANSVVEAVAFSTGGWLVQLLTAPIALIVDAASFVASAGFVARIKTPEPAPDKTAPETTLLKGIASDIVEGVQAVWRQPVLRGLMLSGMVQHVAFGIVGTLILLYLNQEVGFDPGALGMIFAVGGVSAFAGAVAAGRLTRLGVGMVMIVSLVVTAIGQAFVPLATAVNAVAVALLVGQQLVTDSALTVYDINQVSLRQAIAPSRILGRVNASVRVTESGSVLLGAAVAGTLGEAIGLRAMLWVSVALWVLAAGILAASPVRAVAHIPEIPVEAA